MAIDIAKMRAKLEASKNPQARKEDSTKWKPSEGDQTLRILPTADGDPFKEYHFHYNVGKNPGILCPKRTLESNAQYVTLHQPYGRKGLKTTMTMQSEKLRSCLFVSVTSLLSL